MAVDESLEFVKVDTKVHDNLACLVLCLSHHPQEQVVGSDAVTTGPHGFFAGGAWTQSMIFMPVIVPIGLAIGAMGMSMYVNTEVQLKKGDSIFVYTDGVAEATDANNELFGTDRTVDALNAIPKGASQEEVLKGVRAAVDAFVKEAPQFDDLTMVGLKYNGPQEEQ